MKGLLLFLSLTISVVIQACPFCKSDTAKEIRASLFGPDLTFNLFITILPFLICFLIVYFIYHGGLPLNKKNKFNTHQNDIV